MKTGEKVGFKLLQSIIRLHALLSVVNSLFPPRSGPGPPSTIPVTPSHVYNKIRVERVLRTVHIIKVEDMFTSRLPCRGVRGVELVFSLGYG